VAGIILNEDNSNFFVSFPSEMMTKEFAVEFAKGYSVGQVKRVIFCVSGQRASFDSQVLDPIWKDADIRQDGTVFFKGKEVGKTGSRWIKNAKALHAKGIDIYAVWLETTRNCGREAWLSCRLNDVHYVDEIDSFCHGHLWREHPEYQIAPYETSWLGKCLDYAQPAVVQEKLDFISELFKRYDMDGLELDFTRFFRYFRPGFELENSHIINDFMETVREYADEAARNYGHPVKIGVRIAGHPEQARRLGTDFMTWSQKELVDVYVVSNFWPTPDSDMPLELWRRLLGDKVEIAAGLEIYAQAFPGEAKILQEIGIVAGLASQYLHRGADKIYLFNFMNGTTGMHDDIAFKTVLERMGEIDTASSMERRHVIEECNCFAVGMLEKWTFPCPLPSANMNWMPLRINVGGQTGGRKAAAVFGFDSENPPELAVRVNGTLLGSKGVLVSKACSPNVKSLMQYEIPDAVLHDGDNVVQFRRFDSDACSVMANWFEIDL